MVVCGWVVGGAAGSGVKASARRLAEGTRLSVSRRHVTLFTSPLRHDVTAFFCRCGVGAEQITTNITMVTAYEYTSHAYRIIISEHVI